MKIIIKSFNFDKIRARKRKEKILFYHDIWQNIITLNNKLKTSLPKEKKSNNFDNTIFVTFFVMIPNRILQRKD